MKKIPNLFQKDPTDLGRVINQLNESCKWIHDGYIATQKFDGTATAIIENKLYKRYDAKLKPSTVFEIGDSVIMKNKKPFLNGNVVDIIVNIEGNMITLQDSADEMFGKIMSWTDGMIIVGFELCTGVNEDEIRDMGVGMQNGENPMQYKKRLAREIITIYHNESEANAAQANWEKTFSEGGLPTDIPEVNAVSGEMLVEILAKNEIVESKVEFRRLVKEGAIKIMKDNDPTSAKATAGEEEKILDDKYVVTETSIFKIGKKKFVKVIVS